MSDRRIFVVEDEALIAMEIQDHLRTLGYMIAGHAARGVVALREIPRARPDLVLMDVNLGRGPSGIEVALQLREEIDVPVVFLTAYSDVELAERATQTESFAYIVKPFQPQALRANIEMALYKHAAERRLQDANRRLD
ncbi:MAG: response regulator, partial [Myxococcales bacterium]|nr:response regulator [Myxococcales bacterium]